MSNPLGRIRDLDISLFDRIATQTSDEDRRALLGVQRAVMNKYAEFAYLEIGSHLGGSIQPYLLNPTCRKIYSIDSRPSSQPDDRSEGYYAHYPGNSTLRMLENLRAIDPDAICKVNCFDTDTLQVDPKDIETPPAIVFIDGEHTRLAVNHDFDFCLRVMADDGVVLFHDFHIIYKGVLDCLRKLRNRDYLAHLIGGDVFGVFLDPALARDDEYLCASYKAFRHYHWWFAAKQTASPYIPKFIKRVYRSGRAALHMNG